MSKRIKTFFLNLSSKKRYFHHICCWSNACIISVLLLLATFPLLIPGTEGSPGVLTVPDPYPTIQAAVNAASPGDTIEVAAGIYYENVFLNKSVTLTGEDSTTTIIDADQTGHGVRINASNTQVHHFTIRNGGNDYASLYVNSIGGHTIADNILTGSYSGIDMSESDGCTIIRNTLYDNGMTGISLSYSDLNDVIGNNVSESAYGIKVQASNDNSISDNTLSQNSYSIYLAQSYRNDIINNTVSAQTSSIYLLSSDNNIIEDNTVTDSSIGIYIYSSSGNSIFHNNIRDNSYGMRIVYSTNNPVEFNTALDNDWGFELYDADDNTFTRNTLRKNTWGLYFTFSTANTLYRNNLIKNVKQTYQGAGNTWDNGAEGNYWSDYTGEDTNGDGIGDTETPHLGLDFHPLMSVWSEHEISITNVTSSDTWAYAYPGWIVEINVTVKNKGRAGATETFNVTAKYDNNVIGAQTVIDLANGATETLTFSWNITDVQPHSNYTIRAEATILPDEADIDDNIFVDGEVFVKIPGDANGDGAINIFDAAGVSAHWYPGPPVGPLGYDARADFNKDGAVNVLDAAIVSAHWTWT